MNEIIYDNLDAAKAACEKLGRDMQHMGIYIEVEDPFVGASLSTQYLDELGNKSHYYHNATCY